MSVLCRLGSCLSYCCGGCICARYQESCPGESLDPIGLGLSLACDLFGGWVLWNKFWPHLPKALTTQLLLIFTGGVAVLVAA